MGGREIGQRNGEGLEKKRMYPGIYRSPQILQAAFHRSFLLAAPRFETSTLERKAEQGEGRGCSEKMEPLYQGSCLMKKGHETFSLPQQFGFPFYLRELAAALRAGLAVAW